MTDSCEVLFDIFSLLATFILYGNTLVLDYGRLSIESELRKYLNFWNVVTIANYSVLDLTTTIFVN